MSKPVIKLDRGNKLWDGHRMISAVALGEGYRKIKDDMNKDHTYSLEKEGCWLLPESIAGQVELILMEMDAGAFRHFILAHKHLFLRELREAVAQASDSQILSEMERLREEIM